MPPRIRLTKTLIDSWLFSFKRDDGWEDFLATLNREKKPPTQAMLDGTRFENVLNATLNGEALPIGHEWYEPIMEMAAELSGAQQQVVLFKEIEIDGQEYLLHGVLDYLREGRIWDCKFTKRYELNKYYWEKTSQTSMYLAITPEARDFTYIISDGKYVYRERYPREIVPPIEPLIKQFIAFVRKHELYGILAEKWKVQD